MSDPKQPAKNTEPTDDRLHRHPLDTDNNVVEAAAAILGIGRSKLYGLIAAGELRTIHIGRLCKIPVAAIDEFLASRPSAPPSQSGPRLE